jgi:hypothetical protein
VPFAVTETARLPGADEWVVCGMVGLTQFVIMGVALVRFRDEWKKRPPK